MTSVDLVVVMCALGRHELLETCLDQLQSQSVPVVIATEDIMCERIGEAFGFDVVRTGAEWPLGAKMNYLIDATLDLYDPEYIMTLGSDDFVRTDWLHNFPRGLDWVQSRDIYFMNAHTMRSYHYHSRNCFGAGRIINASLLKRYPNPWNPGQRRGLDMQFEKYFRDRRYKSTDLRVANVVDVKSKGQNIGKIETFLHYPEAPVESVREILSRRTWKRLEFYKEIVNLAE